MTKNQSKPKGVLVKGKSAKAESKIANREIAVFDKEKSSLDDSVKKAFEKHKNDSH